MWNTMNDQLLVSEMFGNTVQGEGQSIGQACSFLRTGGCPMRCWFCDTAYTWRFNDQHPHVSDIVYDKDQELFWLPIEETAERLKEFNTPLIVISGGEPMVQADTLHKLITHYLTLPRIEIETAGIIYHEGLANTFQVFFNVSPKLKSSGNPQALRYKPDVLDKFSSMACAGKAVFKFVVCDETDLLEVEKIVNVHHILPNKVYLMPEGTTTEALDEKMKWLLPIAVERNWNLTDRLHIRLFGNRRGV
jgi:7-carboxy-7-deazaguanine synthase